MEKIIKILQKDLIKIYRSGLNEKPLYLLAEDNCSEASRLIAIWIKRKFNEAKLFILKGEYVPKKFHDVLVCQLNDKFYLIDASVWQFSKKKKYFDRRIQKHGRSICKSQKDLWWKMGKRRNFK